LAAPVLSIEAELPRVELAQESTGSQQQRLTAFRSPMAMVIAKQPEFQLRKSAEFLSKIRPASASESLSFFCDASESGLDEQRDS
jgi:hypothetical protein